MKSRKMTLGIALIIMVVFPAFTQQYNAETDFKAKLADGGKGVVITDYLGTKFEVRIPLQIQNLPVTHIGEDAFSGKKNISDVIIPNSVIEIGEEAFEGCSNLTNVTIGNNVKWIGNEAFSGCNSLTNVTIPDSVTGIGSGAFSGCKSLRSITIKNSVADILGAFRNCENLAAINVDGSNTAYSSVDGVLYSKDKAKLIYCPEGKTGTFTIPNSVTSIGDWAFQRCTKLTSITMPNSVTSIGNAVFLGCGGLTAINVGGNNTAYCSVDGILYNKDKSILMTYPAGKTAASFTIPNSVTSIGGIGAFEGCRSLTSITIPNSVTNIDNSAFRGCTSLTSVTIPSSVTNIGRSAFWDCTNLTSVRFQGNISSSNFPDNSIMNRLNNWLAFRGDLRDKFYATNTNFGTPGTYTRPSSTSDRWTRQVPGQYNNFTYEVINGTITITNYNGGNIAGGVVIPSMIDNMPVTSIGERAFRSKELTSITIPNSVISIGGAAFSYNQLTSITIPNSVTSIGESAFSSNKLTSVTIPGSVTSIGDYAFTYNQLTSITIPASVTHIGRNSFTSNPDLVTINVSASNPNYSSINGVLYNKNVTTLIQWPKGKTGPVTIPNSVTIIGAWAFWNNQLTSITIPNSVISIGDNAFYENQLTSVAIPDSVTSIGYMAFATNQLTSVTISASVISIGAGPFIRNPDMTTINVSANNPNYCSLNGVLYDKKGTTLIQWPQGKPGAVTIPNNVIVIGGRAFDDCQTTSVTIPNSVISIEAEAFVGNKLTSVTIPNNVTSIGDRAFAFNQLTSIIIPDSVTSIGAGVFSLNELSSITIGSNVSLNVYSFEHNFNDFYERNNKKAGTYRRNGDNWTFSPK